MGADDLIILPSDIPDRPDTVFDSGNQLLSNPPGLRCHHPVYGCVHGSGNGHSREKYVKTTLVAFSVNCLGTHDGHELAQTRLILISMREKSILILIKANSRIILSNSIMVRQ